MCLSKLQDAITFAQHLDQHGQCTMDLGPKPHRPPRKVLPLSQKINYSRNWIN